MKTFLKVIALLSILISLAILLYFIVLSLNGVEGLAISFVISMILIIPISISMYGMIKGNIAMLKIRKRIGSFVLFAVSIFYLLFVIALGLLNIILEEASKDEVPSLKESVLTVTNVFIPIAYKEGLLTEEYNGITFRFPKGEETSIDTIKSLYPKVKEELDLLYGADTPVDLTIMIYESVDELNSRTNKEKLSGFYLPSNQSIHIVSEKSGAPYEFQDSFTHEYTHYRTDQFLKHHHISSTSIPQWFNEGISEYVMNMHTFVDIDLNKKINFKDIDTNNDFHKARRDGFDPYLQSYYAVRELVLEHGKDVIPSILIRTKNDRDFYTVFQETTGMKIEEFQTIFLNRREEINVLLEQAGEAEMKKEFKVAENLYLKIASLDPYDVYVERSLSYVYIKQGEFEKAMDTLKKMKETDISELYMMSELSLLKSLEDSLKYAEMAEEAIRKYNGETHYTSEFADAIRNNRSEPVIVYKELLNEELIDYKEIQIELVKRLKQQYPNEQWIQDLNS